MKYRTQHTCNDDTIFVPLNLKKYNTILFPVNTPQITDRQDALHLHTSANEFYHNYSVVKFLTHYSHNYISLSISKKPFYPDQREIQIQRGFDTEIFIEKLTTRITNENISMKSDKGVFKVM